MKKQIRLLMLALLVALLQACGGDDSASTKNTLANINTDSPDGAFMAVVQSLKNNDVNALMQISMSAEEYDKAVKEFETAKNTPTESDKAQFNQMMSMLTNDDAENLIMAMVTPKLEQMRAQLPMMLMMGKSMASQMIESSSDVPDDQKETATRLATALMDFVSENDILSEEVTRKAISTAISTAKNLDMTSLEELQNMSYDDAMVKASIVMGGAKDVLGAYGISLDDLLSSVEVSDVMENGDNASMKLAYKFLGQTFNQDMKMVKKEGKWVADK
ncbi:MAG: hypothetical protein JKY19_12725 [Alcanivoracaceae bacterium]|nr:hypothetical protein [Alcanivoracaceae bacterium]